MFQAGVPEPHKGLRVLFNRLCLPDGCCNSRDTDFNHRLVIVIGLVVLFERTGSCEIILWKITLQRTYKI